MRQNHGMQRTRLERFGCNHGVLWAGSLIPVVRQMAGEDFTQSVCECDFTIAAVVFFPVWIRSTHELNPLAWRALIAFCENVAGDFVRQICRTSC